MTRFRVRRQYWGRSIRRMPSLRRIRGLRTGSLYDIGISRRRLFEFWRVNQGSGVERAVPLDRTRLTVKFRRHDIQWDRMVLNVIDRFGTIFVIPREILRFIYYRENT